MVDDQRRAPVAASRFHGTLIAGPHSWHVYFLDVRRLGGDWIIQCSVVGPAVLAVTIRCRAEAAHPETARRVMTALRGWLVSGELRDDAYLEVPQALELAS